MDRKLNCMKSMAKIGMIVVPVAIATKIIIDKSVVNYEKRQRQNIEQIKRKVIDNISQTPEKTEYVKIESVINSVLTYYNISEDEIYNAKRTTGMGLARNIIDYLCSEDMGIAHNIISEYIEMEYSVFLGIASIIYGERYIKKRIEENDITLMKQLADIREILSKSQT